MNKLNKITVLIPCYNEEKGIGKVISGVPVKKLLKLGYETEILVVDNNSKDKTSCVARKFGARVIQEKTQGKRYALFTGFEKANSDIIVTIDGDNTYPPQEIPKLMKKFKNNDLIVGTRFDSIWNLKKLTEPKELVFRRVIANKIGAELGSIILGHRITDVTSGLRVFRKDIFEKILPIKAKSLDFEAELTARVIAHGLSYKEVKTISNFREGNSSLNYFIDAFRFLFAMIRGKTEFEFMRFSNKISPKIKRTVKRLNLSNLL